MPKSYVYMYHTHSVVPPTNCKWVNLPSCFRVGSLSLPHAHHCDITHLPSGMIHVKKNFFGSGDVKNEVTKLLPRL